MMTKTLLLRWAVAFCIGMCSIAKASETTIIPIEYLERLQATEALPPEHRVWLWWCELTVLRGDNDAILIEIARIAGSFGIGDHWTEVDYRHADTIASTAGVPLVLNTMPFNRKGTPMCTLPPTIEDTVAEIQFIVTKFQRIKSFTSRIEAVTFDMECETQPSAEVRQLTHDITRLIYPDATLVWYRNGDWSHAETFSDGLRTVIWYRPYSTVHTEDWFTRMVSRFPGEDYGVWVSLGSCYHGDGWKWDCPMTSADWTWFGRLWASTNLISETVIFPMPGRPQATSSIDAFIAFVRGVTGQVAE